MQYFSRTKLVAPHTISLSVLRVWSNACMRDRYNSEWKKLDRLFLKCNKNCVVRCVARAVRFIYEYLNFLSFVLSLSPFQAIPWGIHFHCYRSRWHTIHFFQLGPSVTIFIGQSHSHLMYDEKKICTIPFLSFSFSFSAKWANEWNLIKTNSITSLHECNGTRGKVHYRKLQCLRQWMHIAYKSAIKKNQNAKWWFKKAQ